jgi:hypothetical protein
MHLSGLFRVKETLKPKPIAPQCVPYMNRSGLETRAIGRREREAESVRWTSCRMFCSILIEKSPRSVIHLAVDLSCA